MKPFLYKKPNLRSPLMVAGWPGMGHVATGAVSYLKEILEAKEFGEIELTDFFDLPGVVIEKGVAQLPIFPESKFYYWRNESSESDLIIFIGDAQPSRKGYEYAKIVLDVAEKFQVRRLYTCAAAPSSIHHKQKPKVWAVANEARLIEYLKRYDVVLMEEGHISGMNGLLLGVAAERKIEGICLLGELPYYTVAIPNPKSSQAVLEVLGKMLGIEIDTTEFEVLVSDAEEEIDRLVRSSEQMEKLMNRFGPKAEELGEEAGDKLKSLEDEIRLRHRIEKLFQQAEKDRSRVGELKAELDRWGIFSEYEDRFLRLFRKGNQ